MPPGQAKKLVHFHGNGCGHTLVQGTWIAVSSGHGQRSKKNKGH
jgi:hypothetical protein